MRVGLKWACLISLCLASVLSIEGGARAATQEDFANLIRRGTVLSEKGSYADAIVTLEKARELAPKDYTANLLLGLDLLRSGRPKEAIERLQIAAEVRPQEGAPMGYLGKALAAMHQFAFATEAFQAGVTRSPDSAELWTEWADFDLERFRVLGLELRSTQRGMATVLRLEAGGFRSGPETREELLRQSATANPEQAGIWGELGVEQLKRGMRERAAAALSLAQEHEPQASWTLQLDAMITASQGDWRAAEAKLLELGGRSQAGFRGALRSWPQNLVPQQGVGGNIWECARKGSTDCVTEVTFPKSETAEPEDQLFAEGRWERLAALPEPQGLASGWFRHGVALAELQDCRRAIPVLERGLEPGAETAAYYLEVCYAVESQRTVEQLRTMGNPVAVHRLEGDILVRVYGDAQSATEEYREAIHLSTKDPGLWERLAQACMSLGEMHKAQQAAHEALSLDPHRRTTLRLLASMAMSEREYADAITFLNQMLAMDRNDAWTRVQMGIAYGQTGQAEQALSYLKPMLVAGYPDERGALHATLAGVLRKLGRVQEAQSAAAEASRLSNLFQQHAQTSSDDH